ncbi:MAG TPA: NADP-dependent oxidoreductase [Thermoplasmata archaeon]|nr:NADP-dependent oxidoreductase [Thermoplasmata archaeon]
MASRPNRQWLLVSRPEGMFGEQNFKWVETSIPPPKDGEILLRTLWLSCDPTQMGWMKVDTYVPKVPIGGVMRASGIGQVVESRSAGFKVGELVRGLTGWQDYVVVGGSDLNTVQRVPPRIPPELALSLFGITGMTAYFGVVDIARVQAGETFVVSSAAGAVGSIAGQIAKIRGARVVGIAGGPAKCDWLRKEAGFDAAIDYRAEKVGPRLSETCPQGIDVYFDNVGGEILDEVLGRINLHARIVMCGAISDYVSREFRPLRNYPLLITKRGRMEGFIILDYAARFAEAAPVLAGWHAEGRLKQKVDIAVGLEKAPKTLARLFSGENFGKQLLKVADPPLSVPP